MLYLIKSACLNGRHEVLLPLGTPEISGLLQTKGGYERVDVWGCASCQVFTGRILMYSAITLTHQYLLEM